MKCIVCDDDILNPPIDGSREDDYCSCECFEVAFDNKTERYAQDFGAFAEEIKVGDLVRSYDFPRCDDYYVEGTVREISEWEHCEFNCGLDHIHIEVILDTCVNSEEPDAPIREWVYPVHPDSGAMGFHEGGKASRVVKI